MKNSLLRLFALMAVVALAPQVRSQAPARIREATAAIAQGDGSTGRRAAIVRQLGAIGVVHEEQAFVDSQTRRGANIVAAIAPSDPAKASNVLLLGAHYDRVAEGQGVVDNGAACAVLLRILEAVKAAPLKNFALKTVFFDLEEVGLEGSRAYFDAERAAGRSKPAYAVNLDIFGYGDTLFVAASHPEGKLAATLRESSAAGGVGARIVSPMQYPDSDHVNMIAAGVETLGVALIDADEINSVLNMQQVATPPRILTILHSSRDALEVLRAPDAERGAAALLRFIQALDAK